ncbi:acyl-CoA oxidase [Chytriomyces confervae]|uniref:Acyl-coenzyme A oxidase n=1 Tax=Chytriomyces confervae TaxID=246404 RepID=A0A507D309_9FUNG|nr:acyl-CoA oxidase [Chytriomyces confervae]
MADKELQKRHKPAAPLSEPMRGIPGFFYDLKPAEPQGANSLQVERAKATFDSSKMTRFLFTNYLGGIVNEVQDVLENDETFSKENRYYMGRSERFLDRLKMDSKFAQLARELKWDDARRTMGSLLIDEPGTFSLHTGMFMPCLNSQGTDEQRKYWLGLAHNYRIIGCYAQTELGHGSNVQGLETTATYIPETEQFEIHSPSLTASKWWVGGLGKTATHAIVMARLITKGKDFGPHAFIVPIRSLENHKPFAGIMVGDVGPKMGFNCVDNGFILFNKYRIPRDHMLMRYSKVDKEGNYSAPPVQKISYGTMIFVRAYLVASSALALARGATVAIRYSAIRRQFTDPEASKNDEVFQQYVPQNPKLKCETAVIDYSLQQYRLFPIIAQSYALHFSGFWMLRIYMKMMKNMNDGNMDLLPEVHAASSGLKSLTTTIAAAGIEECRRSCGGHGYSLFSGLPDFLNTFLPLVTLEGDNHLLTQQTSRYLLKQLRKYKQDPSSIPKSDGSTTKYLGAMPTKSWTAAKTEADLQNPLILLEAFAHRSQRLVIELATKMAKGQVWNDSLIEMYAISKAHCQYILLKNFVHAAYHDKRAAANEVAPVLVTLCVLFGLSTMESELSEFVEDGFVSQKQTVWLRAQIKKSLAAVRPNAVALVDSWGIPDYVLNSALGRYDGKVYESMFEMALKEPLNVNARAHGDVVEGYEEFLKPLIQRGLSSDDKAKL